MSFTPFAIPQQPVSVTREIKKSRFIAYLEHTPGVDPAKALVTRIKQQHRDARHNCWAYIAGAPDDGQGYGCSDDGEPAGTAGRPMLAALQGADIGEVCVVVTRYSGGIKLGTGGLVRAYGGSVTEALQQLSTVLKKPLFQAALVCDYSQLSVVQHLLESVGAELLQSEFQQDVRLEFKVEMDLKAYLVEQLRERTQGAVALKLVE